MYTFMFIENILRKNSLCFFCSSSSSQKIIHNKTIIEDRPGQWARSSCSSIDSELVISEFFLNHFLNHCTFSISKYSQLTLNIPHDDIQTESLHSIINFLFILFLMSKQITNIIIVVFQF